jgi:general secretion pathway protein N
MRLGLAMIALSLGLAAGVAEAQSPSSGNPLWSVPLDALAATRERPIFSPSRRPPPPMIAPPPIALAPPPPPKPAEPERPPLKLLGTVADGAEGIAIFLDQASQEIVRLRPGEGHEGWILRSVERREAKLEKGRRSVTLALPPPSESPRAGRR